MNNLKPRDAGTVLELLRHADGDGLLSKRCDMLLAAWADEIRADERREVVREIAEWVAEDGWQMTASIIRDRFGGNTPDAEKPPPVEPAGASDAGGDGG